MNNEKLKESLIQNEGVKQYVYTCPKGYKTIGVGRNLETKGLSKAEIMYLLENDILDCELFLEDIFKDFHSLSDARQNVLIEMVFNLGNGGFKKFKKLIEAIKEKDFIKASEEMLNSKWHKQHFEIDLIDGKQNNNGLLRTEKLAQIMKKGDF